MGLLVIEDIFQTAGRVFHQFQIQINAPIPGMAGSPAAFHVPDAEFRGVEPGMCFRFADHGRQRFGQLFPVPVVQPLLDLL